MFSSGVSLVRSVLTSRFDSLDLLRIFADVPNLGDLSFITRAGLLLNSMWEPKRVELTIVPLI